MNLKQVPLRLITTLIVTSVIILFPQTSFSQVPSIASFSPAAATPGSEVVISGNGFASPQVWIGNVKAQVTSNTATSITVRVPNHGVYGRLRVLNGTDGLQAESAGYFSTKFSPMLSTVKTGDFSQSITLDEAGAGSMTDIAAADLDGDGRPEVISVNPTSKTLTIHRNTSSAGSLSFGTPVVRTLSSAFFPEIIKIADLDGDGRLDIIVASKSTGGVAVFQNTGDLASFYFLALVNLSPSQIRDLAIADVDMDGRPDLLLAAGPAVNGIRIVQNYSLPGDIYLGASTFFNTEYEPAAVNAADLDDDGKPELIVARPGNSDIVAYRHQGIAGQAINASTYNTNSIGSPNFSLGGIVDCNRIMTADFDNDGKTDMLLSRTSGLTVIPVRNIYAGTNIQLTTDLPKSISGVASGMSVGDLSGDGNPDFLVTTSSASAGNRLQVFTNNSISSVIIFNSVVNYTASASPSSSFIADLDGDGKPDFAAGVSGERKIYIYHNHVPPPTITSISPVTAPANGTASITITGTGFNTTAAENIVQFGAVTGTVTAATATSLTVLVPANASYGPVTVTNKGSFLSATSKEPFLPAFSPNKSNLNPGDFELSTSINSTASGIYSTLLADLDNDRKPDLVEVSPLENTLRLRKNNTGSEEISFGAAISINVGGYPNQIAAGDVDGDGAVDVIVSRSSAQDVVILRNTGSLSTIASSATLSLAGDAPVYVAPGDLDGDGMLDIAVVTQSASRLALFRNTGSSGNISFAPKVTLNTGTNVNYAVAIADIDGDGKQDLLATSSNGGTSYITIFLNKSTPGNFSFVAQPQLSTFNMATDLKIGDIDGDGVQDIVVISEDNGVNAFSVFRNASTPGIISFIRSNVNTVKSTVKLALGDVNGDGKPEVLVGPKTSLDAVNNVMSIYPNTSVPGTVGFGPRVDLGADLWASVHIQDLDGDGKPDLIGASNASRTIKIYRNLLVTAPSAQTTDIKVTIVDTTAAITWTNGNGQKRAVFVKEGNAGVPALSSGVGYTANAAFGSGSQIGSSGWYCVYNGTEDSVMITGLAVSKEYLVMVAEYNDDGRTNAAEYNASASTDNPVNFSLPVSIVSFNRTTSGERVNTNTVTYTLKFSAPITGLTTANFGLAVTGLTGASVSSVSGSGSEYTITVNTGTGNSGALALRLINSNGLPNISNILPYTAQAYTIDRITPSLSAVSIKSSNSDTTKAKPGDVITLNFTSSEAIDTAVVTIAGHTVTPTVITGNKWEATYTMTAADAEGDIAFSIAYEDLAGNAGATVTTTTNSSAVVFDKTAPSLSSVTIISSNSNTGRAKAGDVVTVSFTANKSIQSPEVSIAGHTVTATNTSGNSWTASYTMLATDTEGTISFSIGFRDLIGNAGTTATATTNSSSVIFDKSAPTLSSVTIASSNDAATVAKVGDVVTLSFTASEAIKTPGVTLMGQSVMAINYSGSSWVATYTMTEANTEGPIAFSIAFSDQAGNAGTTATAVTDGNAVVFDKTNPALTTVNIISSNINPAKARSGDVITLSFTSSEAIHVTAANIAGHAVAVVNGGANDWTAVYTMTDTDTEGDIAFSLAFSDLAGNAGTTVTATTDNSAVTFDRTKPTLPVIAIASSNSNSTLAKVGDIVTLSFTASETIGSPTVVIAGNNVYTTKGSGNNWTATYTMLETEAEGTVGFSIAFSDEAGNAGISVTATTNNSVVVFDKTAPSLSSVKIASSNANTAKAKVGDVVTLSFTASKALQSPTVTIGGHAVTATNASGNNWAAAYTMAAADTEGTIAFSIAFRDLAGNAGTAVTATTNSSAVVFDKTAPALSAVSISSSNNNTAKAKDGDVITLNFTASEAIQAPVVTIAGQSVTATNFSGNSWTASYNMTITDTEGQVAFSIAFADLTGNAGTSATTTTNSSAVVFDKTAPTLSAVSIASSNSNTGRAKVGDVITLSFSADEAIQSPAVSIAGHNVTATNSGNTWTSTYTMTIADNEGPLDFNIGYSDLAGNAGTTTGTTDHSTVYFDKTAPEIMTVSISSSNANSSSALPGDVVTLSFISDEGIYSPVVTIAGHTVTATVSGINEWTASYTMTASDAGGAVAFSISGYTDRAGNAGPAVNATTDNTTVDFVPNRAPSMVNGPAQSGDICADSPAQSLAARLAVNDPDQAQMLTWTVISGPAHGTVTGFPATASSNGGSLTPTGVSYTPAPGYAGTDAITISVSDGFATATTVITFTMEQRVAATRMPMINAPEMAAVPLQARTFGNAYSWSPATGLNNPNTANPTATLATDQEYQVSISTAGGCTTVDTVLVRRYKEHVYVANVFSPNGDGKNDMLLPNLVGVRELRVFRVFNRAGKKIFETSRSGHGWDGRVNGELLPVDTYVWSVEVITNEGTRVVKNGTVSLLR